MYKEQVFSQFLHFFFSNHMSIAEIKFAGIRPGFDKVFLLRLEGESLHLDGVGLTDEALRDITDICVVACGSAYHVGMVAQYVIEDLAKVPVRVELASEFRYRKPLLKEQELVVIISQSGETADSLAALREAKEMGAQTLAIVNVVGSSIAREADHVFYTMAGPEIAVATTKAYSAQLIAIYCLAVQMAKVRAQITEEYYSELVREMTLLPGKINKILEDTGRLQWLAARQTNVKVYDDRFRKCNRCGKVTLFAALFYPLLPNECAYRKTFRLWDKK